MPAKPLRPCSKMGCPNLAESRYCEKHASERVNNNRYYDKYHRTDRSKQFYQSAAWKKARDYIKVRDNGLCQECLRDKRITVGTIVDHIDPLENAWNKRLDEDNLQLLCQACHNKKTGVERSRKG